MQEEFDEPTIEEEDMLEKLCESDGTVPRSFQKCSKFSGYILKGVGDSCSKGKILDEYQLSSVASTSLSRVVASQFAIQTLRNSDTEDNTEDEQSNLDSHNDEAISDEETYNILR